MGKYEYRLGDRVKVLRGPLTGEIGLIVKVRGVLSCTYDIKVKYQGEDVILENRTTNFFTLAKH